MDQQRAPSWSPHGRRKRQQAGQVPEVTGPGEAAAKLRAQGEPRRPHAPTWNPFLGVAL